MLPFDNNKLPVPKFLKGHWIGLLLKVAMVTGVFVGIGVFLFSQIIFNRDEQSQREFSQPSHSNDQRSSSPSHTRLPVDNTDAITVDELLNPDLPNSTSEDSTDLPRANTPAIASNSLPLLTYNITQPPSLNPDANIEAIVNEVLDQIVDRGLPLDNLSISLIDMRRRTSAGYQEDMLRFPASISKLFWMVELFAWTEAGLIPSQSIAYDLGQCTDDLCRMIQDSDNEAASRIIDLLTGTYSHEQQPEESYPAWLERRKRLNSFFEQANYTNINISQKNFPIPYLNIDRPVGFDQAMRGDANDPIRNRVSTQQAGRLMYEIFTDQAISTSASRNMQHLLTRYDLQTGTWRNEEYNSIEGFLGEGLPKEIWFASKVGWTSFSRQEVAFIKSPDNQAVFILVIFGEDKAYSDDWEIFPAIAELVFDRMMALP